MVTASYREPVTAQNAAGHPSNAGGGNARVLTTVTLGLLAVALIASESLPATPHPPASPQATTQQQSTTAVRIVDPQFCDNQTWPYIDQRCLKRADTPPTAPAQTVAGVPAAPAQSNVAPALPAPAVAPAPQQAPTPPASSANIAPATNVNTASHDMAPVNRRAPTRFGASRQATRQAPPADEARHPSRRNDEARYPAQPQAQDSPSPDDDVQPPALAADRNATSPAGEARYYDDASGDDTVPPPVTVRPPQRHVHHHGGFFGFRF
jgi:hypothetical protein